MRKTLSLLFVIMTLSSASASDVIIPNWEATFHLQNGATITRQANRIEYHYAVEARGTHPEDFSFLSEIYKSNVGQMTFHKDRDYGFGVVKNDVTITTSMTYDGFMENIETLQKIIRAERLTAPSESQKSVSFINLIKRYLKIS